jgi:hypothetical protein
MFRVGTIELKLCLQRHSVSHTSVDALLDGISRRVDEVVLEFQDELIAGVCYGEVVREYSEQTFGFSILRIGFQLEELSKGVQLDVQEIWIICLKWTFAKIDPFFILLHLKVWMWVSEGLVCKTFPVNRKGLGP